jgi:hypothetical protein
MPAKLCRRMCGETSDKPASLMMRTQCFASFGIGPPPRDGGNTSSPTRGSLRNTSQATLESGRIDRPVFVPGRTAVRATRSASDHFRLRASPVRHPLSAKNRAAATAGGHALLSAWRSAFPRARYSDLEPSFSLPVPELWNAAHRVVGAHSVGNGVGEDAP